MSEFRRHPRITYSDFDTPKNTPFGTGWDRVPYKYPFTRSVLSIIHFLFFTPVLPTKKQNIGESLSHPVPKTPKSILLNTLTPWTPPRDTPGHPQSLVPVNLSNPKKAVPCCGWRIRRNPTSFDLRVP